MKTRPIIGYEFEAPVEDWTKIPNYSGSGSFWIEAPNFVINIPAGQNSDWRNGVLPYFPFPVKGDEYQIVAEWELASAVVSGNAQVWWGFFADTSWNVWFYYQGGTLYAYKIINGSWTAVATIGAYSTPIRTRIVWQVKGDVYTWQRWTGSAWADVATLTGSGLVPWSTFIYCRNYSGTPTVEGRFNYVRTWAVVADRFEASLTADKQVPQETGSFADVVNIPKYTGRPRHSDWPLNQPVIAMPGYSNQQEVDQELGPQDRSSLADGYAYPPASGVLSHGGNPVHDAVIIPGPLRAPADSLDTPDVQMLVDNFAMPVVTPIEMGGLRLPRTFRYLQSPYHGFPDEQPAHIRGHGPTNLVDVALAVAGVEPFAWSDSIVDGDGKTFLQSWDVRGIRHYDSHEDPWYAPTPGDGFYGYGRDGQFYVDGSPSGPALNGTSFGTLAGGYNRKTWIVDVEPSALASWVTNMAMSLVADDTIKFNSVVPQTTWDWAKWVSSRHRWCLIGDFDIQLEWKNRSVSGGSDGGTPVFQVSVDDNNVTFIRMNVASNQIWSDCMINGGWGQGSGSATPPIATSGKFRITRVGQVITRYYWNTSTLAWVQVATSNNAVLAKPLTVIIGCGGTGNLVITRVDVFGFTINSGTTVNTAGWYREAASANRGNLAAFPDHTAIVDTYECVSIIDLDTNKVWMRFIKGSNNALHTWSSGARPFTAAMRNGRLLIADGDWSSDGAAIIVDFTSDNIIQHRIDGDAATGGFLRCYNGVNWGPVGRNARDAGPVGLIACRNLGGGYGVDANRYRIQGNNVWDVDIIEETPDWYYWAVATNLGLTLFGWRRHWNDGDGNQGKNLWGPINVKHATGAHVYWAKFNPDTHDLFYASSTTIYRVARADWLAAIALGPDNGNLTPTDSLAVPGTSYPNVATRYGMFYGNDLLIANGNGVWRSTWPGAWTLLYGDADSAAVHKILPRGWTIFASSRITESHAGIQELLVLFLRRENQGMIYVVKLTTNMPWAAKAKYDGSIYPLTIAAAD